MRKLFLLVAVLICAGLEACASKPASQLIVTVKVPEQTTNKLPVTATVLLQPAPSATYEFDAPCHDERFVINSAEVLRRGVDQVSANLFDNVQIVSKREMVPKQADLLIEVAPPQINVEFDCGTDAAKTWGRIPIINMFYWFYKAPQILAKGSAAYTPPTDVISAGVAFRVRVFDRSGQELLNDRFFGDAKESQPSKNFAGGYIEMFLSSAWSKAMVQMGRSLESSAKVRHYVRRLHEHDKPAGPTLPMPSFARSSDIDEPPATGSAPQKSKYAVVIGIEQYRGGLPRAEYASKDALIMTQYLAKAMGYPEQNIVVLLDEKASLTDLRRYFEDWLPNNVERDGSVFIYFAGHGAPDATTKQAYLMPYDGDPSFLDKTGYPLNRLYENLSKLPAKEILVVLDAGLSGTGSRSVLPLGARPIGLKVENPVLVSGKLAVLAADSGTAGVYAYEDQGHGLFTYYFLKGLRNDADTNRDRKVSLGELYAYIKTKVQESAKTIHTDEQSPQLIAPPNWMDSQKVILIELGE